MKDLSYIFQCCRSLSVSILPNLNFHWLPMLIQFISIITELLFRGVRSGFDLKAILQILSNHDVVSLPE